MKFHKISNHNSGLPSGRQGVTIVELLIVVAIIAVLAGLTTPFVLRFYGRYVLISERSTVLGLLREARTLALSRESNADHGLYIAPDQFVLFTGSTYATRDTSKDYVTPRQPTVSVVGLMGNEIVFYHTTGLSTSSTSFNFNSVFGLVDPNKSAKINVNSEGTIEWR